MSSIASSSGSPRGFSKQTCKKTISTHPSPPPFRLRFLFSRVFHSLVDRGHTHKQATTTFGCKQRRWISPWDLIHTHFQCEKMSRNMDVVLRSHSLSCSLSLALSHSLSLSLALRLSLRDIPILIYRYPRASALPDKKCAGTDHMGSKPPCHSLSVMA
jgi:hypothetical protein